jgi:hypothetical protein
MFKEFSTSRIGTCWEKHGTYKVLVFDLLETRERDEELHTTCTRVLNFLAVLVFSLEFSA